MASKNYENYAVTEAGLHRVSHKFRITRQTIYPDFLSITCFAWKALSDHTADTKDYMSLPSGYYQGTFPNMAISTSWPASTLAPHQPNHVFSNHSSATRTGKPTSSQLTRTPLTAHRTDSPAQSNTAASGSIERPGKRTRNPHIRLLSSCGNAASRSVSTCRTCVKRTPRISRRSIR